MSSADLELLLFRQGGDPNEPLYGLRLRFRPAGSSADTLYSAAAPLRFDLAGLRARRSGDYAAYGAYLAGQLLAELGWASFSVAVASGNSSVQDIITPRQQLPAPASGRDGVW